MGNIELAFSSIEEILERHRKNKAIDQNYATALQAKGRLLISLCHFKEALIALE